MNHRALTFIALAAASLLFAGCGGGDDAVVAEPAPAVTPDPTSQGQVVGSDGSIVDGSGVDPSVASGDTQVGPPEAEGGALIQGMDDLSGLNVFQPKAIDPEDYKTALQESESSTDLGSASVGNAGVNFGSSTATSTVDGGTTEVQVTTTYTGAKIVVDGKTHSVNKNGSFPSGNPLFKLVGVTSADIEIKLLAGEFVADGSTGIFLNKGQTISLVNSTESVTYKIKYASPIVQTNSNLGF